MSASEKLNLISRLMVFCLSYFGVAILTFMA